MVHTLQTLGIWLRMKLPQSVACARIFKQAMKFCARICTGKLVVLFFGDVTPFETCVQHRLCTISILFVYVNVLKNKTLNIIYYHQSHFPRASVRSRAWRI